ncbi:aspartate kinase [Sutterella faecalis]|uniref:Aspartokinase n=2 Tax=Sutterella TaxID=40544 RepID=A0AAI9SBX8_9BURK|nr:MULTISPECIES: aspartate kinase [Sutterella]KAB7650170.1 aspartate kinase [Sutterella seckii]QDA53564.1 aspartate kinase [Sutterella faecalis]
MLKITKFGGSSCASAEQFRKVKAIIEADPSRRFVVISAAGRKNPKDNKITDLLYLCRAHVDYHVDYRPIFEIIRGRFLEIKHELGLNTPIEDELDAFAAKVPDLSVDELVSRGEYFTSRLMADFLGFPFVDAVDIVAMEFDGTFNFDKTTENLKKVLEKHDRFVMPGFYGRTPDGAVKVMTRGGSDISGSILARCLRADLYENWTDVSGFLMADPRIVKDPKNIERITYAELRELSYMGASVLHEDAIFPIREYNIPIHVLNTNRPQDPGTLVLDKIDDEVDGPLITGIAGKKGFLSIEVVKRNMSNMVGIVSGALDVLRKYEVSIEHLPSGIDSFNIVLSKKDVEHTLYEILADIKERIAPDSIRVTEPLALIAIVGRNMNARAGSSGKLFTALGNAGVNIRMISQGSSEIDIIVGVANADFDKAVRALYQSFAR